MRYQRDASVVAAFCPILLFVVYHDDGIFPLLRHFAPPPNTNDDIEQSPAQGGIIVEGDLEQLNGDSARSDSLSVRQRADGVCELLHRGLNSKRHVFGPLSRPSAMFGSSLDDLGLRRVCNHRTHRSRMSSTSLGRTPFSSLTYAELRSRFPSRFIVLRCL